MKPAELRIVRGKLAEIRPFIRRERKREPFERMKESMRVEGLKIPVQVRDISNLPTDERRRPDGGLYRYELMQGEGRCLAAEELGWTTIPMFIIEANQAEIVGRFLAENMIRRSLPWLEKARLVRADLDAGVSIEDVAERFFVTPKHVLKMAKILGKAAPDIDLSDMTLTDADKLTTLPAEDQRIVVAVLRDTEAVESNVAAVVAKARAVKLEAGTLSSQALKKSLTRVADELEAYTKRRKALRLHHAIGPQNIQTLLAKPDFRKALKSAGISTERFEEIA